MRKLTDEELSRVLSQQAVGLLRHDTFGRPSSEGTERAECGCVGGAAVIAGCGLGGLSDKEWRRAMEISNVVSPNGPSYPRYPETAKALLAYLAERGLA